jgi:dihydroxyacetone kinase DhaKLM complex PTS-EIIA-like component DhaM
MKTFKKFTEAAKQRMYSTMGTAKMECELALNLSPENVNIFQMKNKKGETIEGVYYLVGKERNEKGLPTQIHFKKDFRN